MILKSLYFLLTFHRKYSDLYSVYMSSRKTGLSIPDLGTNTWILQIKGIKSTRKCIHWFLKDRFPPDPKIIVFSSDLPSKIQWVLFSKWASEKRAWVFLTYFLFLFTRIRVTKIRISCCYVISFLNELERCYDES